MKRMILGAAAAAGMAMTFPVNAQKDVKITTEKIAPNVAILYGQGGNIAVSFGEDGTVMIDDQFAPLTKKIQKAVADLGAQPVKFLINTHWHGDHTGGNENFGKAGAIIAAHENVRIRMAQGRQRDGSVKPAPKAALPVVTYSDGIKLHLNGEEVRVIALPAAHTDGDSMVYWPESNIVHMGDTFFNKGSYPFVDLKSGGSVTGAIEAADIVLAMTNQETIIIPGHGKVASRTDLTKYRNMLVEIIGKVGNAIKQGKSLDAIKAMRFADGYGVNQNGFITADKFIETVYTDLAAATGNAGGKKK